VTLVARATRSPLAALATIWTLFAACGADPGRPVETSEAKAWSKTPLTPEWTDIAKSVAGDHVRECEAVYIALTREEPCQTSLCEHAASLAHEWQLRCPEVSHNRDEAVAKLVSTFDVRAAKPATDCGRRATSILRDQCSDAQKCRPLVERWAASCAVEAGTPLVRRLLERAVDRAEGASGYAIDQRSCGDLFIDIAKSARCESRRQCEDAVPGAEAYAARCFGSGQNVTWPTALSILAVMSGAGKRMAPVPLGAVDAARGPGGPLALGEERGALLRLCGEPVTSGKQVVQARRDCKDGELVFAKVFEESGGPVVRVGTLRFGDDRSFAARFPELRVVAEDDARAALALPEIEKALDQAAAQVRAGGSGEAWQKLVRVLVEHVDALDHPRVKEALAKRDEAVAPALRELGRAKVGAAKRASASVDLAAFAQRASTRILGDLRDEGIVDIGVGVTASADLIDSMPRSVAAYRDAVSDMGAVLKQRGIVTVDPAAAAATAREELARCTIAVGQAKAAEEALMRCAFALDTCDETMINARTSDLDRARAAKRTAVDRVDALVAGPAQKAADAIGAAQRDAGCVVD